MEKHEFEEMFRQVMKGVKQHYPELLKDYEPKNKRWRAEKGEKYWFAFPDGQIDCNEEDDGAIDAGCYNRGNYFKTKEEAELYDKKRVVTQKVKDIAIRLGEPERKDWFNGNMRKYYLCYNFMKVEICQNNANSIKDLGVIYCLDPKFLSVCLEEIGEEDLKLIFT